MNWIPVSERLPEPGHGVLMWIQPYSYVPGAMKLGAYMATTDKDYPWRSTWDSIFYKAEDVTHWMPLPSSPNVQPPADDPLFTREVWQRAVAAGLTTEGYDDWKHNRGRQ